MLACMSSSGMPSYGKRKRSEAKQAFEQFLSLDSKSDMATDVKNVIAQIAQRANK